MRNEKAYDVLAYLLSYVIAEYPRQALWLFTAVAKSTTPQRASRSKQILSKLRVSIATRILTMIFTYLDLRVKLGTTPVSWSQRWRR